MSGIATNQNIAPRQLFEAAGGACEKALRSLAEQKHKRSRFSPYTKRAGSGENIGILSFPLAAQITDGENA